MPTYLNGVEQGAGAAIVPVTLVVAASDSLDPTRADYQCDGIADNVEIQAALDALPATGGEVRLLDGTYSLSAALVMDSYQTLSGCGRNTILVNGTGGAFDYITAVGGSGTEKVGLKITNLCCDGSISGTGDIAIDWTFVDYSQICGCWLINMANFGLDLTTSDYNDINDNIFEHCQWDGIRLYGACFNNITGNVVEDTYGGNPISAVASSEHNVISGNAFTGVAAADGGLFLLNSPHNTITGNVIEGYLGGEGISLAGASSFCTITGNTIIYNEYGILIDDDSGNCTITGNIIAFNIYDGLYCRTSYNTIVGNNVFFNGDSGITLGSGANHCLVGNNSCYANSQEWQAGYENILLSNADYNLITGNLCRAPNIGTTLTVGEAVGASDIRVTDTAGFQVGMGVVIDLGGGSEEYHLISAITAGAPGVITISTVLAFAQGAGETIDVPEASYGINISNAGCNENRVTNNDLYDGGVTAPFNDAGTGTKLDVYVVPFSDGTDPQDSGYEIDLAAEFARAWLRLPPEVIQVVRLKIYARAIILSGTTMALEINVNGGADNEPFNTHATAAPNSPSTSTNFAADDVIYWTLSSAQIIALLGGDSVEVKVLHEDAGVGGVVTDAFFRTVEIEYV